VLRGRVYRGELDVIEGGVFGAIGSALDAQRIAVFRVMPGMRWRARKSLRWELLRESLVGAHSGDELVPQIHRNREMPFNWSK